MEISFEKGKFVYCPGGFNYQEVLDDFKRAKKVRIITYNISGTGNTDPLLEQIKKLGEDVDVQIITNIPSRFETYYSSAAGEAMRSRAKHNIEVYLKKLNPESFPTAFSISFNFFNHAKIIGTENIVYIGSANFSNESKQNIETGVIIEDSAFIARLLYAFILRRTELSRKNGWADEYGRIFLYYPICEVVALLHCGRQKAVNTLRELQYAELIEIKKQGCGKPNCIYPKSYEAVSNTDFKKSGYGTPED